MNLNYPPFSKRLFQFLFMTLLAPFALLSSGCGAMEAFLPQKGESVKALELDPTHDHSLVETRGARWVLFKVDVGGGARRIVRGAFDGAASVGQKVAENTPEERIMEFFQTARESATMEQARGAFLNATPGFAPSAVP